MSTVVCLKSRLGERLDVLLNEAERGKLESFINVIKAACPHLRVAFELA